jgi:hypothetical protein
MAKDKDKDPRRVITPEFRVSYPSVFNKRAFEGQEAKYGLTMIFKKKTDISKLKAAARAAAVEKWGADEKKWPRNLRKPFRDGAEREDVDGYGKGVVFVAATSKTKPGLIDKDKEAILDEESFYAGCYARAELFAFAYDKAGNKGVTFGLRNIQKLRDGEPFASGRPAEEVFGEVDDDSEDEEGYGEDDGAGF